MKLIKIDNLENLGVVNRLAGGEFLQAWFWGEMLTKSGETIERFGVEEGKEIIASITLIKKKLGAGFFYLYAPRGPVGQEEAVSFLLRELKKRKSDAVFLRIEPEEIPDLVEDQRWLKKSVDLQPKKTLFLDLGLSEEELLAEMHQKTRYNIKLAEKKGIKIIEGTLKDFNEFWRLISLTGERDGFRLHGAEHYKNLLASDKQIKLFFANYEGKNIAAGLFCFSGDRAIYLHGASDNEARSLMAPYLLQWEVIKMALAQGAKYYDFYGIDEKKWPGVTRFKLGFGGFTKEYPGTHDFVFQPFIYRLYNLLRKLRRSL